MTAIPLPIATPALLASLRNQPHVPKHAWYFIAATTLTILNRPDEIPHIYNHVMRHGLGPDDVMPGPEEQLTILRKLREALVKASAVGGLPKTINSLMELKKVTPEHLLDEPQGENSAVSSSPTARNMDVHHTPSSKILQRGQGFWDNIYGKISRRVMGQMDRSGTEDLGLTARLMYGYILSNTNVLSPVETSYVLIAGLIPQDVNPQLKGHLRGALNCGASVEEVRAVRAIVMDICKASGMSQLGEGMTGGWGWRSDVATV
ncbi:carboxymuconolactone decarboxylase [Colletotrichum orchidophilum]|uniref:Carboxymuconolactone decarboxylase n=1 Tax=Colletotrichum orchidophilum TaxID=1209926 RepID=A0A1G4ANA9_9PEZI|nr:carboxymuconolactone decarboxylase [Colletotrichum orchidophilum]OHE90660.1 carboxymuconolactone decarboxylase [Colletotrichum orchidophilum]